ncbi:MAG TPA: hypothetical protein VHG28_15510 [Longimicrobiaceae bacterium]|nr:hypothetical protein [Longimicrobiaceae bacterium]
MSKTAAPDKQYHWFDYVRLSGTDGACWLEEYRRWQPVVSQILQPLEFLRRGEVAAGCEMLDRAGDALSSVEIKDLSLRLVMDRWYYGVLGYSYYCRELYDEADRAMVQAQEALATALREHDFLLVMADDAFELNLHRARIARNRQRWGEMWEHCGTALAMREGTLPYYPSRDGSSVWISTIVEFFDSLPVPKQSQPLVPHLQDLDERKRNTERSIRGIVRFRGLVIEYP